MSGPKSPGLPCPPPDESTRVAHIYLDESNFRISAESLMKKQLSFDPRARLNWNYDVRVLKGIIRRNIGMKLDEKVNLRVYGSNLEQCLEHQELKRHTSHFRNFPRKENRPEKQVDTTLVRDMSVAAGGLKDFTENIVLVLVSGDSDMKPAVTLAMAYGYEVHVFAWKDSLSREYKQLARQRRITVTYLDDFLSDLAMSHSPIRVANRLFPRNGVVLLNPWHYFSQHGHKFVSCNMTLMRSDGRCPDVDIVVVPRGRILDQDAQLLAMLKDFEKNGLKVMNFAEYFHSSRQLMLHSS